jgi:hypothetical protein
MIDNKTSQSDMTMVGELRNVVADLRRELTKAIHALDANRKHLEGVAEGNAALHCAAVVVYSPLHAMTVSTVNGLGHALARTEIYQAPEGDAEIQDNPPLTPSELAQIESHLAAATLGPWHGTEMIKALGDPEDGIWIHPENDDATAIAVVPHQRDHDATLIIRTPTYIRRLLSTVAYWRSRANTR